jgi:3alpha(or 20beta)-hydroxysteroid dehydrogenase
MIADVLKDVGEQTAAELPDCGFVQLDVTGDAAWEAAIAHTVAELGGLDVLVNNAGVEVTQLLVDTDPDQIRTMLEVNVLGTMLGLKHGLRAMRPGGAEGTGGTIINVASVAATIASQGSRATRPRSLPSTGSPAWPRWSRASSATACASTASTRASCRPTWA